MSVAEAVQIILPVDSTPTAEAAEIYSVAGFAPIPIYGLTPAGECMCGAGADCPPRNRGKHPVGALWQKRATAAIADVRDRFRAHVGNIGIYLAASSLVLVDADGILGLATAEQWQLPETLTAVSGSGVGAHYIYRFASDQDPLQVTDRSKFAPGLDVKARGQFVAAPSRHASGGIYRWTRPIPPTVLPDWLYDRIRKPSATPPQDRPSEARLTPDGLERRARAYMAKVAPAIAGSGGHTQCFAAARALAGIVQAGLSESIALQLLREYSAICQPPWSEKDLLHKWNDAKSAHTPFVLRDRPRLRLVRGASGASTPGASTSPDSELDADAADAADESGGAPPPEPPAPPGEGGPPDWRSLLRWATTRSGADRLVTDTDNLVRVLQLDPRWQGKISFDEFHHRICVSKDVPWDSYNRPSAHLNYWTDEDATRMSGWMCREWHGRKFEPTRNDCENAVIIVARTRVFHPVRDYLDALSWDGTPRLATWLSTYFGAFQSPYTAMVGPWWLISGVARIYEPGCKVDTVPILEGPQGLRKSTALKTLFGADFFNDTPIDIGNKDAFAAIQGCWGVELAELESLMRATPSAAKTFFSSAKDRFRRAYTKHERDELRQCIFVGTVNLSEYLNDPTGARRFLPIRCTRIDLDALIRDRDQLWAEAADEYRNGRTWYPETESDKALLEPTQESRTYEDAWETKIRSWLASTTRDAVSTSDVLLGALGLEPRDWTRANQTRVGIILTSRMKMSKKRISVNGKQAWVYVVLP